MKWFREVIFALAVMLIVFSVVAGVIWLEANPIANPFYRPAQAAGGGDDPTLCDPWKMAGGVMIYRCLDEETYTVCYTNGLGMIACVEG